MDAALFSAEDLLSELLDLGHHPWREHVTIVPDYMPPYPRQDTRPTCQVRFSFMDARDGERASCFLRHSKGPRQGHSWDIYGDDYLRPALALIALLQAPPPPQVMGLYMVQKFTLPLRPSTDARTDQPTDGGGDRG